MQQEPVEQKKRVDSPMHIKPYLDAHQRRMDRVTAQNFQLQIQKAEEATKEENKEHSQDHPIFFNFEQLDPVSSVEAQYSEPTGLDPIRSIRRNSSLNRALQAETSNIERLLTETELEDRSPSEKATPKDKCGLSFSLFEFPRNLEDLTTTSLKEQSILE